MNFSQIFFVKKMYLYLLKNIFEKLDLLNPYHNIRQPFNYYKIINTNFFNLSIDTSGSAIYMFNSNLNYLNINKCLFYYCNSKNDGGSIYFNSDFGSIIISFCCCLNSFINNNLMFYGQFSYIKTSNNNNTIIFLYNSIIKSAPITSKSRGSIYFEYGNITISNINSSFNICDAHTSTSLWRHSYTINKFNTIFNNTANYQICLHIYCTLTIEPNSFIIFSNIISNSITDYGIFGQDSVSTLIDNCIFYNNNNYPLFNRNSYLYIYNCIFDYYNYYSITPITSNISILINPNTLLIQHFLTTICFAENPILTFIFTNNLSQKLISLIFLHYLI